jgi:uncharacterized membrane protein
MAKEQAKKEAEKEAKLAEYSEEEPGFKAKLLSGLAYLGTVLLLPLFVPLNLALLFISRSKFTRYNCLQALVLFAIDAVVGALLFLLFVVAIPGIMAFVAPFFGFSSPASYAPVVLVIGMVSLILANLVMALALIFAAILTFLGHTFRLPLLSGWAERIAS